MGRIEIKNCYNWLLPGGHIVLNLVDIEDFDPIMCISPQCNKNKAYNKNENRRIIKKKEFPNFSYKATFKINLSIPKNQVVLDEPNASFSEVINFKKDSLIQRNVQGLFMPYKESICQLAVNCGLVQIGEKDLNEVKYKNQYLYWFYKPY